MAFTAHHPHAARSRPRKRGHNPVAGPVLLFVAAAVIAGSYIGYVLWPRWPEAPVALDAAALPINIGGTFFTIEPAAIRQSVQRRPGTQDRVDLAYLWPSLTPPDPARKATVGDPVDPNERLFLTIQTADGTLPLMERVKTIYPRYMVPNAVTGPEGLTVHAFRPDTPYRDEELVFEQAAPEHFLARCTRKGVVNAGTCLLERHIGNADITVRFPRDWLGDWQKLAGGIDRLMARLHPEN
jgi:hypothetical protein